MIGADEALDRLKKTKVNFVNMPERFESIKPNTFPSGLKGI